MNKKQNQRSRKRRRTGGFAVLLQGKSYSVKHRPQCLNLREEEASSTSFFLRHLGLSGGLCIIDSYSSLYLHPTNIETRKMKHKRIHNLQYLNLDDKSLSIDESFDLLETRSLFSNLQRVTIRCKGEISI
uniref:Uncharacterized protein n=1 Tax=Cucumis melo TaxID=3656 RepID=A0A9I9E613_CUCME